MVFDMMRPLGAQKGELEINALALKSLSGPDRTADWAPEMEYAFADGSAIEFELPFKGRRLEAFKLGLQTAFGGLDAGRSPHGVQYLGVYDRHDGVFYSSALYMIGHRFNRAVSTMSMVGVADVSLRGGGGRNALLINHSTFLAVTDRSTLGVELNYRGGQDGAVLLMPQWQQKVASAVSIQFGLGAEKVRQQPLRPKLGLRTIREF